MKQKMASTTDAQLTKMLEALKHSMRLSSCICTITLGICTVTVYICTIRVGKSTVIVGIYIIRVGQSDVAVSTAAVGMYYVKTRLYTVNCIFKQGKQVFQLVMLVFVLCQ